MQSEYGVTKMDIEDLMQAGNAILNEVWTSVNQGDFQGLSDRIKDQVTKEFPLFSEKRQSIFNKKKNYFLAKKVNRQSGIGRVILGGFFSVVGWFLTSLSVIDLILSLTVVGSSVGTALSIYMLVIFGGLTAASMFLLRSGMRLRNLAGLYYEYGSYLEGQEYFSISQLADRLGISQDLLTRNLLDMKKQGMLPMARMDSQKTTVMLTDRSYRQYCEAEESRKEREARENQWRKEMEEASSGMPEDISRLLQEGRAYIVHLKEVNQMIPDDDPFSQKLYRQEMIVSRIFEQVEKQPETAHNLRRFMDYYLPTTQKLIDAYADLYQQPDVGKNITNTKAEISDAIDMVNEAFENLLNSLFQDIAWDVSSDISVMKTMLSQDGLTDDQERSSHE